MNNNATPTVQASPDPFETWECVPPLEADLTPQGNLKQEAPSPPGWRDLGEWGPRLEALGLIAPLRLVKYWRNRSRWHRWSEEVFVPAKWLSESLTKLMAVEAAREAEREAGAAKRVKRHRLEADRYDDDRRRAELTHLEAVLDADRPSRVDLLEQVIGSTGLLDNLAGAATDDHDAWAVSTAAAAVARDRPITLGEAKAALRRLLGLTSGAPLRHGPHLYRVVQIEAQRLRDDLEYRRAEQARLVRERIARRVANRAEAMRTFDERLMILLAERGEVVGHAEEIAETLGADHYDSALVGQLLAERRRRPEGPLAVDRETGWWRVRLLTPA